MAAEVTPSTIVATIEPTYDSKMSAPMPATSPTLSPTLSAIVAGFLRVVLRDAGLDLTHEVRPDVRGLREDPTADRANSAMDEAPIANPEMISPNERRPTVSGPNIM